MTISDFAIKRPIITVVTMLMLVIFGIFALFKLEVDEFPDLANPIVFVAVPYPGASPSQVEREVVESLEEAFAALSGVDEINSTSLDGFAQIIVQFQFSKDPDQASQDVRDAISGVRAGLPLEMEEPILRKFDPADMPIVSLVLASDTMDPAELTLLADPGITRSLRGINGVAQVEVVGGVEREISVELRPADLEAAGVTVAQVVQALQSQNLAAPVGRIEDRLTEQAIRLRGRLESPREFEQLVISARGGSLVRLGQVAGVRDGTEEPRSLALYDDQGAVSIDITKSKGVSTTRVANDVKTAVERLRPTLPQGVSLEIVRDAGERVESSVSNVQEALVEGAILTILVVFLFLNSWRSTVITGLALPVSVLSSFIAVWAFGFTLNTMSLLGLSLAIGILIDDAIVVRENIVRHIEMGKDHVQASHEGTNEIAMAVAATTFSIIAVFVPVAFMEGMSGQWFKPFARPTSGAIPSPAPSTASTPGSTGRRSATKGSSPGPWTIGWRSSPSWPSRSSARSSCRPPSAAAASSRRATARRSRWPSKPRRDRTWSTRRSRPASSRPWRGPTRRCSTPTPRSAAATAPEAWTRGTSTSS
jgi:HAE1 family hydrophobic/amphiphilic exporter-1